MDWLERTSDWTAFLRAQDLRFSLSDDLNVAALADVLREKGIAVTDAGAAARWFGPLLSRTADNQDRLAALLQDWDALQSPAGALPADTSFVGPAVDYVQRYGGSGFFFWFRWGALGVGLAVLSLVAVKVLSTPGQGQGGLHLVPTPIPVERLPPFELRYLLYAAAIVLVPFVVLWFVRFRDRRRDGAIFRGLVPRDAEGKALRLRVSDLKLLRPRALSGAVADLRRHQLVPADGIDGTRSVAATVRAAGRVQLVAALRPAMPEHLLLVDLSGRDDLMGMLAELITTRLREGQVKLERYDYSGDPRRLRRLDDKGRVIDIVDIETLRGLYPDHRLVLLSDASNFSEFGSGRMRGWVSQLSQWGDRALVTPLPPAQWGPRERALIRLGFRVVQASPAGIADLGRQFRAELPLDRGTPGGAAQSRLDRWLAIDPHRWLGDVPPGQAAAQAMVEELRRVLGPKAFYYLCALAVFPVTHPKLTIALGELLCDEDRQPLLSDETLPLLCRVPWLRKGRIPDWLRLALVRDLNKSASAAQGARAAWTKLLEPEKDGIAANLPIEVVRSAARISQLVAALLARQGRVNYREAILISFLNGEEPPELTFSLTEQLSRRFRTWLRYLEWAILPFGVLAAATAATLLGRYNREFIDLRDTFFAYLGQSGSDVSEALYVSGWASFAFSLVLIYLDPLRKRLGLNFGSPQATLRRQSAILASLSLLLFILCALSDVSANKNSQTLFDAVALAGMLLAWCSAVQENDALLWVPLVVATAFELKFANGLEYPRLTSLYTSLIPLSVWLGRRLAWQDLRRIFAYGAPAFLIDLPLGSHVTVSSTPALYVTCVLCARFASDKDFRERCLAVRSLSVRQLSILFLPLAIGISTYRFDLQFSWFPSVLLVALFFLLGFALQERRRLVWLTVLSYIFAVAATVILSNRVSMMSWLVLRPDVTLSLLCVFGLGLLLREAARSPSPFRARMLRGLLWVAPQIVLLLICAGLLVAYHSSRGPRELYLSLPSYAGFAAVTCIALTMRRSVSVSQFVSVVVAAVLFQGPTALNEILLWSSPGRLPSVVIVTDWVRIYLSPQVLGSWPLLLSMFAMLFVVPQNGPIKHPDWQSPDAPPQRASTVANDRLAAA